MSTVDKLREEYKAAALACSQAGMASSDEYRAAAVVRAIAEQRLREAIQYEEEEREFLRDWLLARASSGAELKSAETEVGYAREVFAEIQKVGQADCNQGKD